MANRRDLTDRNREQQQPLQPIDFCQGLPFKVRWMGRDPQTGRDLVQFSDGSIVRAGKRIFSGNCPRGTMVDVVDCGANGMIVIDWRDAEIRQPLVEVIDEGLQIIIDTGLSRFYPFTVAGLSPYYNTPNHQQYLSNIKGTDRVLFANYGGGDNPGNILVTTADEVFNKLKPPKKGDFDQVWITSGDVGPSDADLDVLLNVSNKFFLLAQGLGRNQEMEYLTLNNEPINTILKRKFGLTENPTYGAFNSYVEEGEPSQNSLGIDWIDSDKVVLSKHKLFEGVSALGGGVNLSALNTSLLPMFEVIASTYTDEGVVPTIAIYNK